MSNHQRGSKNLLLVYRRAPGRVTRRHRPKPQRDEMLRSACCRMPIVKVRIRWKSAQNLAWKNRHVHVAGIVAWLVQGAACTNESNGARQATYLSTNGLLASSLRRKQLRRRELHAGQRKSGCHAAGREKVAKTSEVVEAATWTTEC